MIRGYIASSLDGFIAAPDGSFAFLERYPPDDAGYDAFVREIGTVVMGRLTYEAVLGHSEWPYAGKRSIVVTSHPPASPPPDTEAWTAGVPALVAHLAAHPGPGDIWILGGGRLQQAFLDAGAIERLEIYIVPEILGDGIPLFPGTSVPQTLRLIEAASVGPFAKLVFGRAADAP